MPETIILDLDGPLLDGVERHYACYSSILRQRGFRPIAKEEYWSRKRRRGNRRELLSQSGAAEFDDEFLTRWLALIETPEMLALDRLQPDVLQILGDWKDAGVQLVLATMRSNRDAAIAQLRQLRLLPFFDDVFVTGSRDTGGKAAAVRGFLKHHAAASDKAVWVGDTEVDVHAARTLNLPVYAVTCGLRTKELLLAEGPDNIFCDLRAVSAALGVSGTGVQDDRLSHR